MPQQRKGTGGLEGDTSYTDSLAKRYRGSDIAAAPVDALGNIAGDTVGAASHVLGKAADSAGDAAGRAFSGPKPDKTALSLQPPKPPANWAAKTKKKSAFYGD